MAIDALESGLPERSESLSFRVDCVSRGGRRPPDDRILPVVTTPLPALADTPGVVVAADAPATIAALERGRRFYLERPKGHRVDVIVVPGFGRKHIRTEADRRGPGLLLDLPECE